jgi:hypothetical protein
MANDGLSELPRVLHEETYRGVKFKITETVVGPIGSLISGHHDYLRNGFLTDEECDVPTTPEIMRRGIDRMIDGYVVYYGDLRDR